MKNALLFAGASALLATTANAQQVYISAVGGGGATTILQPIDVPSFYAPGGAATMLANPGPPITGAPTGTFRPLLPQPNFAANATPVATFGGIAADTQRSILWSTDGTILTGDPNPNYAAFATIAGATIGGPPPGPVLGFPSTVIGSVAGAPNVMGNIAAISGLGMDSAGTAAIDGNGPVLWMADTAGSIGAFRPGTIAAPAPTAVRPPFTTPGAVAMTGVAYETSTNSLWMCSAAGAIFNLTVTGVPIGPQPVANIGGCLPVGVGLVGLTTIGSDSPTAFNSTGIRLMALDAAGTLYEVLGTTTLLGPGAALSPSGLCIANITPGVPEGFGLAFDSTPRISTGSSAGVLPAIAFSRAPNVPVPQQIAPPSPPPTFLAPPPANVPGIAIPQFVVSGTPGATGVVLLASPPALPLVGVSVLTGISWISTPLSPVVVPYTVGTPISFGSFTSTGIAGLEVLMQAFEFNGPAVTGVSELVFTETAFP